MEQVHLPLITVVLTAYNHQNYIGEAIFSVLSQSYSNIQLIVIDNASKDKTCEIIERLRQSSSFLFIKNSYNRGLCPAFNQGLAVAEGKYVIDLSGDDVLLPNRIKNQVRTFEQLSDDYVVVHSNAQYIDQAGTKLNYHFKINNEGKTIANVPSGDIYKKVLEKYFICTPTMLMRTAHLKSMGGYDESLSFEDFDFWVRSSARYGYFYLDEVLTLKRITPDSLSSMVYKKGGELLQSYYVVCNKAYDLNRSQEEFDLLAARIRTFIRKCFYAEEFELALKFRKLLNYIENPGIGTEFVILLCRMRLPVNTVYRFYINYLQKNLDKGKDLAFDIVS